MNRLWKSQKTDFHSPGDEQKLSQYSHERGLKIPMEIDNLFKGRNTYKN